MKEQKIYLSPTKIRTFLDCNKKYKYQYMDKIDVPESKSTKYLSLGTSIHSALADFNKLTDMSLKSLENLHRLLQKHWIRDGYEDIKVEKMFYKRGLDMLTKYFYDPKDQGQDVLIVEELISIDYGNYVLCGKLDKVYITNDNKIEIIDYKTGKSVYPLDDLQLPIYLMLLKNTLGIYPHRVSSYFLEYNKKVTREITERLLNSLTLDIHALCKGVVNTKDFNPNPSSYCKANCRYHHLCSILNFKCKNSLTSISKIKH